MTEVSPPIRPPETKPPLPTKPAEHLLKKPADVKRLKGARGTLEQIAKGVPVTEATAPQKEALPSNEAMKALLEEGNAILLELKDMRLVANAIATQAADTPLGKEVQADALRNILTMSAEGLPPEQQVKLLEFQNKIKDMKLPEPKPSESATLGILTSYNELHPDTPIPNEAIDAVRSGEKGAATTVSQMMQTNNELAQMVWKDLTGQENMTSLNLSRPGIILDLAGLPQTEENKKKIAEMFTKIQSGEMKAPPASVGEQAYMGIMYLMLGIIAFSQIALGEGGGGGH